jgi:hypothetical protein
MPLPSGRALPAKWMPEPEETGSLVGPDLTSFTDQGIERRIGAPIGDRTSIHAGRSRCLAISGTFLGKLPEDDPLAPGTAGDGGIELHGRSMPERGKEI